MHGSMLSRLRRAMGAHATTALIAAGLGAALLLAACGGGKATATPTAAPTTAATAAAATATAAASGTAAGGGSSGAGASAAAGFCGDWGKMVVNAAAATGLGSASASGTPTDMKTSIEQTTAFVQALSNNAPSEIKADFQVYAQFWTQFASAMAKANYDFTKVATDPTVQAAFQALNDPKFEQATQHIDAWVTQNCGG